MELIEDEELNFENSCGRCCIWEISREIGGLDDRMEVVLVEEAELNFEINWGRGKYDEERGKGERGEVILILAIRSRFRRHRLR